MVQGCWDETVLLYKYLYSLDSRKLLPEVKSFRDLIYSNWTGFSSAFFFLSFFLSFFLYLCLSCPHLHTFLDSFQNGCIIHSWLIFITLSLLFFVNTQEEKSTLSCIQAQISIASELTGLCSAVSFCTDIFELWQQKLQHTYPFGPQGIEPSHTTHLTTFPDN